MQTRQERIKALYLATYDELQPEDIEKVSLEEMEKDLTAYYRGAGFDIDSIDAFLEAREVEDEVASIIRAQLEAARGKQSK